MAGLSDDKIAVLRQLMIAAPDPVIYGLESMLAEDVAPIGPLASIRLMVEAESADRALRNAVLAPVLRLFAGPAPEGRLSFPRWALMLVWKGLKAEHPELVRAAANGLCLWNPDYGPAPESFDALCAQAAEGLREGVQPDFEAAARACDQLSDDGAAQLAGCLDLAPIVRPALVRLSEWVQRMTSERTAAVRVAYRDAVAVHDDAGPRFFEMLTGHLSEPWLILRVISAVMDRPTERYLASSELASFGERVLADIDAQIAMVRAFDPAGGIVAGRRAGAAVQSVCDQIAEFEESVQLSQGGPWHQRISKQRKAVALSVEIRLKETDERLAAALPLQSVRFGARLVKGAPRLTGEPDPPAVEGALAVLAFADEVRAAAANGGFGAVRNRVLETAEKRLELYVEDVLDRLRGGETEDPERARRYLEIAADFMGYCRDEKAAQIVRRRAAAA